MPRYEVTMIHRFEIEAEDIKEVFDNYEFPDLQVPGVEWVEFIDSSFTHELKD